MADDPFRVRCPNCGHIGLLDYEQTVPTEGAYDYWMKCAYCKADVAIPIVGRVVAHDRHAQRWPDLQAVPQLPSGPHGPGSFLRRASSQGLLLQAQQPRGPVRGRILPPVPAAHVPTIRIYPDTVT